MAGLVLRSLLWYGTACPLLSCWAEVSVFAAVRDEAVQQLKNERAKREDWSAFGDEWDAVDKKFRIKWRPTPYGGDRRQQVSLKKPKSSLKKKPAAIGADLRKKSLSKKPAASGAALRKKSLSKKPAAIGADHSATSEEEAAIGAEAIAKEEAVLGAEALAREESAIGAEAIDKKRAAIGADEKAIDKKPKKLLDGHSKSEQMEANRKEFAFKAVAHVGNGTYGEVFKVELLNTDVESAIGDGSRTRFCAMKVQSKRGDAVTLSRTQQRELDIMTKLSDAALATGEDCHIVRLIDTFYSDFNFQLLMPLFDGDLWHLVNSGRTRLEQGKPDWLRTVGKDILRGLAHIHSERVLHRDLSPSNVLISAGGQPFKP